MAEDEVQIVTLRDDFYRDSFGKVILIMISLLLAIFLLAALSVYLYMNKPQPLSFLVDSEWRVQADVPVNEPLMQDNAVFQWVNDTFNQVFIFDFIHYNDQLQGYKKYFTDNGWNVFLNHINSYANSNTVEDRKLFVTSTPTGAPTMITQGLLTGRYFWLVEFPINVLYLGYQPQPNASLLLQVRVVRVSTMINLAGVAVDDVVIINKTPVQAGTPTLTKPTSPTSTTPIPNNRPPVPSSPFAIPPRAPLPTLPGSVR